jgi:hypothetical protein
MKQDGTSRPEAIFKCHVIISARSFQSRKDDQICRFMANLWFMVVRELVRVYRSLTIRRGMPAQLACDLATSCAIPTPYDSNCTAIPASGLLDLRFQPRAALPTPRASRSYEHTMRRTFHLRSSRQNPIPTPPRPDLSVNRSSIRHRIILSVYTIALFRLRSGRLSMPMYHIALIRDR